MEEARRRTFEEPFEEPLDRDERAGHGARECTRESGRPRPAAGREVPSVSIGPRDLRRTPEDLAEPCPRSSPSRSANVVGRVTRSSRRHLLASGGRWPCRPSGRGRSRPARALPCRSIRSWPSSASAWDAADIPAQPAGTTSRPSARPVCRSPTRPRYRSSTPSSRSPSTSWSKQALGPDRTCGPASRKEMPTATIVTSPSFARLMPSPSDWQRSSWR